MARTKTTARAPRTARSAAHAAPDPAPVPGTSPVPGSAAAAVHAALTASPGATTTAIAGAAGISRPAARDALAALEAAGEATRTKGGKPGIADTWTLAAPGPSGTEPAGAGHDDDHAVTSQPGADPADAKQDDSAQQEQASGTPEHADGDPGQGTQPDGDPADGDPAEDSPAEDSPAGEDTVASHEQDQTDPPAVDAAPAVTPPDPALVAQVAGHIEQIQAAASAAATALAGGADLSAAQAGLDEIYEQAAQARRAVKAAAGGKKAPAVQPGGLREKVLAHLRANPGASFTPHEIHKVNGHSSGAIANALETLVKHGDAEVATEKPRRFRLADGTAAPAEAQPPAEPADDAAARTRRRTWRVPHDHPRRWPGRQHAAPARRPRQPGRQWFRFGPWMYDVGPATRLLRAAPRPPAAAAGHGLGTRLRADPRPRHQAARGRPDRPRPRTSTPATRWPLTSDDPVIIATLTAAGGEPAGPLLIDGYALTDTVH